MDRFANKQKAIDLAVYQNLSHRFGDSYGVVLSSHGDYMVVPIDHNSFEKTEFEKFMDSYADMGYDLIRKIYMDAEPLDHWEDIKGMFSIMHGETLRFLLKTKLPLEKFIRYELANRGYDENFQWVGFERAGKIWLDDN